MKKKLTVVSFGRVSHHTLRSANHDGRWQFASRAARQEDRPQLIGMPEDDLSSCGLRGKEVYFAL